MQKTWSGSMSVVAALGLVACAAARPEPAPSAAAARLLPCPSSPNCVSSRASDPAHFVEPLRLTGEPEEAIARLRALIEAMPRARVTASDAQTLHAELTSLLFRFVDDVDVVVDTENNLVHIRSASRLGYSDWGVNRRRVEALRQAWEAGQRQ